MGTRSCIAVPTDGGWKGVYCHWDGYPTGEGLELVGYLQTYGPEKLKELIEKTPQGFSSFPDSPYPEEDDPAPITSEDEGDPTTPLMIEWVYVVFPDGMLTVYTYYEREPRKEPPFCYGWKKIAEFNALLPEAAELMASLERTVKEEDES